MARKRSVVWALGLAVPFALGWLMAFLMRPEPGSLLAPLLGPWAGLPYGHSDCTLAHQTPGAAVALAVLGVAALAGGLLARRPAGVALTATVGILWACAWEVSAFLSVMNSTA